MSCQGAISTGFSLATDSSIEPPETPRDLGIADPIDPCRSLHCGRAHHLRAVAAFRGWRARHGRGWLWSRWIVLAPRCRRHVDAHDRDPCSPVLLDLHCAQSPVAEGPQREIDPRFAGNHDESGINTGETSAALARPAGSERPNAALIPNWDKRFEVFSVKTVDWA
jgi:hypothetical protein